MTAAFSRRLVEITLTIRSISSSEKSGSRLACEVMLPEIAGSASKAVVVIHFFETTLSKALKPFPKRMYTAQKFLRIHFRGHYAVIESPKQRTAGGSLN